jgi:curli production assembly/transport component CsgF
MWMGRGLIMWRKSSIAIALIGYACCAVPGYASEQVYHPNNPTFGGNPLNGTYLLSTAQAQGNGAKSGQQGPDLTGLDNALSNLGKGAGGSAAAPVIVIGAPTIPSNP